MLDVGRKPFDQEYLQDIVKNMSWYKLNDFQCHLNDNYIFLEEYILPENTLVKLKFTTSLTRNGLGALHKTDLC